MLARLIEHDPIEYDIAQALTDRTTGDIARGEHATGERDPAGTRKDERDFSLMGP